MASGILNVSNVFNSQQNEVLNDKKMCVEHLCENEGVKNRKIAVENLRKKIKGIREIKNVNTDDEYLLRFLYSSDFNEEVAFKRMNDYHKNVINHPEWYEKDSPYKKKECMDTNAAVIMSSTDKEGRPIYIRKIGNWDPDKTTLSDEACIDDIWYEYILDRHPEVAGKGVCMILDFAGVTWKYLKIINYKDTKLNFKRVSCLPFKDFKIHIVNNTGCINLIMKIVRLFIPKESKKQLYFHSENWESLYTYIEKDDLPPEYGGYNKINYKKIYDKLYEKNDVIANNFMLFKSVLKS